MYRRLGLAVMVVAMVLAACGRQVTGLNAPGGNGSIQSGHMLIRFRIAGPFDFTNVRYVIVFNTSGNGGQPLPQAQLTGFQNYSFALVVGGSQFSTSPILLQYFLAPGTSSGIQFIRISIPPELINYVPNSGGNPSGGGEFTINFDRSLLFGVNPGGSPTPTVPTATAAPTPTGTPVPGATPTAGATFNPNVQPTSAAQTVWQMNFITTDVNGIPQDSMGTGGATDTQFSFNVNTSTFSDNVFTKPAGSATVSSNTQQLSGYEVINSP